MTGRLAIFDCDGTLVDGQAAVCEAMEAGFAAAELPVPDRHDIRRIVGLSLPQAIRLLAPEASEEQRALAAQAYKDSFFNTRQSGQLHEPLFDGIEALLRRMHSDGWHLAVATGKSDRGLKGCLEMHGLTELFVSLQTADRHPSKPHPSMIEQCLTDAGAQANNTVMIGDTTFDIDMAVNAQVRALGVSWGYHTSEELLSCGAVAVAEDAAHLERLL
ncbi:HAD-IA family hydrolase [Altererythrobacter lutimaris]|uniref:HAD-IA family hydrolase n=1 Tax=Altererythrobacter lutimaris TaxID=2743979 RepID=A0A850H6J4_9SPHN|nr:HAD-IA family hydrolase [Altererythrobacter lutimaris]NVE94777.1 HAD-IA family hydrolase [Altererythrobacter lutimaris]